MEETILGTKQARQYLKQYSEQTWNRVAKATFLLGIQYLSELENTEAGEMPALSLEELEDLVEANEAAVRQRARQHRAQKRSRSRPQAEPAANVIQPQ